MSFLNMLIVNYESKVDDQLNQLITFRNNFVILSTPT